MQIYVIQHVLDESGAHRIIDMFYDILYVFYYFLIDIDDCALFPCYNEATCIDQLNNFTCACAYGYSGDLCEERKYIQNIIIIIFKYIHIYLKQKVNCQCNHFLMANYIRCRFGFLKINHSILTTV